MTIYCFIPCYFICNLTCLLFPPPPIIRYDGTRHSYLSRNSMNGDVVSYVNISNVQKEDGGVYRCEARNEAGSVHHSEEIFISGPPFIKPLGNITVLSGNSLVIRCPVTGYPIQRISWLKGYYFSYSYPLLSSYFCYYRHYCYPTTIACFMSFHLCPIPPDTLDGASCYGIWNPNEKEWNTYSMKQLFLLLFSYQ